MDLMQRETCYDLLNLAKYVFKDGLTGTIVLGDRLVKTFTALPEHFTMTDFDIHIADSSEAYIKLQTAQQMNMELIKGQQVDAEMAFDILDAKSLTEMKRRLNKAIQTKKAENNMLQQLQQQVQQYESNLKQDQKTISDLQNEIKRLQSQVEANNDAKIQIEQKRVEIEEKEAADKKDYNDKLIEVKEKQLDAEIMQM
jgi:predicted RNase H-like nuclease (RuvC/YqgF family)